MKGSRRPSDDDLLRRFFAAKEKGDMEQAAQTWETLCVGNRDRIELWVRTWRHPDNGQRLPKEDAQEAVQDALDGATRRMVRTLRGRSLGEFRGSLKRLSGFAAHNQWRRWVRHDRHIAGSLDETLGDEEGGAGRYDYALAEEEHERGLRGEEQLHAKDRITRALDLIPNEKQRTVLKLELLGYTDDEIAEVVGETVGYVYQLRRRGLLKLKEVLGDVDS